MDAKQAGAPIKGAKGKIKNWGEERIGLEVNRQWTPVDAKQAGSD
jgi:hypothetical protein